MQLRDKKGFTLIELIMVIVIIGVLAAVAIPTFGNLIRSAREGATRGSLGAIRSAIAIEYAKSATSGNPAFPNSIDSTLFASGIVPSNALVAVAGGANASVVVVGGTVGNVSSDTAGWWYNISSGRAGAYTDDTAASDPSGW